MKVTEPFPEMKLTCELEAPPPPQLVKVSAAITMPVNLFSLFIISLEAVNGVLVRSKLDLK